MNIILDLVLLAALVIAFWDKYVSVYTWVKGKLTS